MQWSNEKNAGFSAGETTVQPLISGGPFGYCEVNVAKQRAEHTSLLNWTERTIRLRKEVPEIGWGEFMLFDTAPEILAMRYDWHESATVFIHNLSDTRLECLLDVTNGDPHARDMVCLQTDIRSVPDADGKHRLVLEPYGYNWYRLGGLDALATHTGGENPR
jgi:maltose alpha-D-glucosyltransferase/alpha-amylase